MRNFRADRNEKPITDTHVRPCNMSCHAWETGDNRDLRRISNEAPAWLRKCG